MGNRAATSILAANPVVLVAIFMAAAASGLFSSTARAQPPGNPAGVSANPTSRPGTNPPDGVAASPARAPNAVSLDTLLSHFPVQANARVIKNAPATVEGKVIEVYIVGSGPTAQRHLVMVGSRQADDQPAHVTCVLDRNGERQTAGRTPGFMARVTGTWGKITTATNRIDLLNCTDVSILPADKPKPNREMPLAGRWSGIMPSSPPMPMTVTLDPDKTAKADFEIEGKLVTLPGTWSRKDATTASLTLQHADGPVDLKVLGDDGRVLLVPSIPPLYYLDGEGEKFQLGFGTLVDIDFKTPGDQTINWLKSHAVPAAATKLVGLVSNDIEASTGNKRGWTIITGAGILAGGKTAQVCMMNGQEFEFDYTDAQARAAAVRPGNIRATEFTLRYPMLKPEVVIDSVELADGRKLSPGRNVAGKITLHAIHTQVPASYRLIMEDGSGAWVLPVPWQPSLDGTTFDFSFPPNPTDGTAADTNPRPLFFSVARTDAGLDTPFRISKTIGFLMDVDQP